MGMWQGNCRCEMSFDLGQDVRLGYIVAAACTSVMHSNSRECVRPELPFKLQMGALRMYINTLAILMDFEPQRPGSEMYVLLIPEK